MFRRPYLRVVSLLCALTALFAPPPSRAGDPSAQRMHFLMAWEVAQHGPAGAWRKLAAGLESYPLFPYLELASLQRRIRDVQRPEASRFLAAWPDSLPAKLWREAFLSELARREDWKDFLDLYTPAEADTALRCDALHARVALGKPVDFGTDVEPLWLSAQPLPDACSAVVAWANARGKLTSALVWQRIDLAAGAGQAALVDTLASMLDGGARADALRLAAAIRDPAATLTKAMAWPDGTRARQAARIALLRLARRDSDAAETAWKLLSPHFHFDTPTRDRLLRALAIDRASSYAPDALGRLDALPAAANDDTTREWRVRTAVAAQDWQDALAALDAMDDAQKADARWRYLRARVLVKLDRTDEATPLFDAVAREANFHGFLAADWLKLPYTICPATLDAATDVDKALRRQADLARAFEFFAIGRLPQARREWDFAMTRLDATQRRQAVLLAAHRGWHDRAVYAFNRGADLRFYDLRFPLAQRGDVVRDARDAGIDPAWAYAIIRAESAWTADARSGADAYGLMQLLPGTARHLARNLGIAYSGASALFDPDVNIRLGTQYLGDMAVRYDGSPWLATAAYNAGSDPVGRWIDARDSLDPDFFIETIPYKETREYVARVLAFAVIYDWRLNGKALPLASRLPRIGQAYSPPPADAPRKDVVCPATPATSTAASAAAAAALPAAAQAKH
ncbi:MAG: transglycosylase SLT domain-containing protein [Xanthomonadaceae bacterium]|nr:transglycosylase SLT domain-containing protein [Xanthomonadaceae bacterium]